MGNNRQMIRAIKPTRYKLLKSNLLIVDDMVQACQWQQRRPTLGACIGIRHLRGCQLVQWLKKGISGSCIKIARRNDWLCFSPQEGGYLHQLRIPLLPLAWRNRRHEVNAEKRDAGS